MPRGRTREKERKIEHVLWYCRGVKTLNPSAIFSRHNNVASLTSSIELRNFSVVLPLFSSALGRLPASFARPILLTLPPGSMRAGGSVATHRAGLPKIGWRTRWQHQSTLGRKRSLLPRFFLLWANALGCRSPPLLCWCPSSLNLGPACNALTSRFHAWVDGLDAQPTEGCEKVACNSR